MSPVAATIDEGAEWPNRPRLQSFASVGPEDRKRCETAAGLPVPTRPHHREMILHARKGRGFRWR